MKRLEKPARSRPPSARRCPFRVLVDGRENLAYHFDGLRSDGKGEPLVVEWQWGRLRSGDYSIVGHESRVAIERKSLADLYSTLGGRRRLFEEEHQRLAELDFAAVVIEAGWETIICRPPERSALNPKTVFRTGLSWMIRYGVPWIAVEGRRLAEVTTFRLLERWYRLRVEEAAHAPAR